MATISTREAEQVRTRATAAGVTDEALIALCNEAMSGYRLNATDVVTATTALNRGGMASVLSTINNSVAARPRMNAGRRAGYRYGINGEIWDD